MGPGGPVQLAVLVKAVPRSEALRIDPGRRSVVREGTELVLNPFDQRALRVALELRRPGETVTAVSLGPPSAGPLLREACAVGAEAALHLCDTAFAGSDVLATSEALASALRTLSPGLVLGGAYSVDGDTGLVGPQVAARLGWPVVTLARSIRRGPPDLSIEVDVDTPTGWATVTSALPAVVTVGEKIARPLPVTAEQFSLTPKERVRQVGPAQLDLAPSEVGAFASPTSVEAIREVAPARLGRIFAEGPPSTRVLGAVGALGPILAVRSPPPPPLPWPPEPGGDHELVVLVSDERGGIEPGALGLLTCLRRSLPAYPIVAAAYGPALDPGARGSLEQAGALGGYLLDPGERPFDSGDVARGLGSLLDQRRKLRGVVVPSSSFGREVAGQLAAARSLGTVADATDVRADPEGRLDWSKPSFGGTTLATVRCRSTPAVVTMPLGLASASSQGKLPEGFGWVSVPVGPPACRVRRTAERTEPFEPPEVDGAEVLVAVGSGVGGPEGIARLLPTVRRWGAALVATRRVVDAGWVPPRRQVGLTGRFLAPRLAVLLGVRGAHHHMVGWTRAGAIVAVNRDADAPVFRLADAGIVGTVEEVVPELAEPLERVVRSWRSP